MGAVSGKSLPAPDNGIGVTRIELQSITTPAGSLCGHDGGAAAQEGIQNNVIPGRAIHDGIGHQSDRLYRRVQSKKIAFFTRPAWKVHSLIVPNIAAITPELTKLHVVAMRGMAVLEDEHELVLAAVERAHAGIVLAQTHKFFSSE